MAEQDDSGTTDTTISDYSNESLKTTVIYDAIPDNPRKPWDDATTLIIAVVAVVAFIVVIITLIIIRLEASKRALDLSGSDRAKKAAGSELATKHKKTSSKTSSRLHHQTSREAVGHEVKSVRWPDSSGFAQTIMQPARGVKG